MSEHLGLDYGGRRTRRHDAPRKGKTFSDFVQKNKILRGALCRGAGACAPKLSCNFLLHTCAVSSCACRALSIHAQKALALFPVSNDCLAQVADAGKV